MMRRGIVVGFEYPARYLARLVNAHARDWSLTAFPQNRIGTMRALWHVRGVDALISFGGPGPNAALALAAHQRDIPLMVIWAGTDVLNAAENPFELEVTKRDTSADVAVSPWLAEELRAIGVPAAYQPVISASAGPNVAPFPKRFTVLTYLPAPRRTFYGEDKVYAIARALKDVRFLVIGTGAHNPSAPPNIEFLGRVEPVDNVINDSTVLLRLPRHDGQSMMVLEAMAHGRHVIWTHDLPGVRVVRSIDDALDGLEKLYRAHLAGELRFNDVGRAYVASHCSPSDVAASFENCLNRMASGTRSPRSNGHRKRVAISGYGLFCADIARNIERYAPEWEAQILRPASRIGVAAAMLHISRSDVWYSIGSPVESQWIRYGAQALGVPRVVHWVGSDIECARTDATLRHTVQTTPATHLTEIDWTAQELADIGVESQVLPLPLRHQGRGVKPLPERFTIMLYIPKSRPDFYGLYEYERLLQQFSGEDLRIFVVGGGSLRANARVEVVNCGWRSDLSELYSQSTVLIRCTPHDGLALMVLEALSFGRHVIWSKPFPYARQVSSPQQLATVLRDLLERHKRGTLHAQYAAAEAVRERYATERCVADIVAVFETARAGRAAPAIA